jgi:hypothetical protein
MLSGRQNDFMQISIPPITWSILSFWLCLRRSFNRRAHLRTAVQHKKGCYHAKVDHLNRCNRHRRCRGIRVVADCARLRASEVRSITVGIAPARAANSTSPTDMMMNYKGPACRGTVGRDLSAPFDSDLPSDHHEGDRRIARTARCRPSLK